MAANALSGDDAETEEYLHFLSQMTKIAVALSGPTAKENVTDMQV